MEHCDEHLKQAEQIKNLDGKIDDIKGFISKLTEYIPKIETALNQVIGINKVLEESSKTHRQLFDKIDNLSEKYNAQELKLQEQELRLNNLEETRKEIKTIRNTIIASIVTAFILAGVGFVFTFNKMQNDFINHVKQEQVKK